MSDSKENPVNPQAAPEAAPAAAGAAAPAAGAAPAAQAAAPERRRAPRFEGYKPGKFYAITLSPVALLLAGALPFHHFIFEVIVANPVLNGLILFVLALGAAIIVQRVSVVLKQFRMLNVFTSAFKVNRPINEVLNDPAVYYSGVGQVIVHIAETEGRISSRLVQNAINEELEHLQHKFQAGYEVPNYIVGFMIAMGLTGTFIGLLETMLGISAMLGGINSGGGGDMTEAIMGLITELQKPLAGMGTAFSASLFGLIGSVVLGMMMLALKYVVHEFMSALRRYIGTVVKHDYVEIAEGAMSGGGKGGKSGKGGRASARAESAMSVFVNDLSESQLATQEALRQGQEATVRLSARIDKLTETMNSVAELLKSQVESSRKTNELIGFGPRMRDLAEETLAEIRKGNEGQRQQGVNIGETTRAVNQLEQRMTTIGLSLSELAEWLATDSNQKQGGTKAVLAALGTLQERMTVVAQETEQSRNVNIDIARHVSANAESQKKLIELLGFGGRMRDIADQTLSEMKVMTSLQRESSGSVEQLGATLSSLDQRFVRISNQLTQMATDVNNQSEAGRNELKGVVTGMEGVQEQLAAVVRETAQNRNVTIDIARHVNETNTQLAALRSGNDILARIQEGGAAQTAALELVVAEIKNSRNTVVRDIRSEMRELGEIIVASREEEDGEDDDDEGDDEE